MKGWIRTATRPPVIRRSDYYGDELGRYSKRVAGLYAYYGGAGEKLDWPRLRRTFYLQNLWDANILERLDIINSFDTIAKYLPSSVKVSALSRATLDERPA
jgi:hypothetical protein